LRRIAARFSTSDRLSARTWGSDRRASSPAPPSTTRTDAPTPGTGLRSSGTS